MSFFSAVDSREPWWLQGKAPSIESVISELLNAKARANRRAIYLAELKRCLGKFLEIFRDRELQHIGPSDLEYFLAFFGFSLPTRRTMILRLSVLFSFAQRRGYIQHNPIPRLERPMIERRPPRILSPKEAERLVEITARNDPAMLSYIIIGLYVGARPTEIERLKWADFNFETGILTIDAAASKVRHRRIVPLDPKALLLLIRCRRIDPVVPNRRPWRLSRIGHWLGWPGWQQNILRHTAASMLLAKHKDAAKVALWLGNSPEVLLSFYHELVSPTDAADFWSLTPTDAKEQKP